MNPLFKRRIDGRDVGSGAVGSGAPAHEAAAFTRWSPTTSGNPTTATTRPVAAATASTAARAAATKAGLSRRSSGG